MRPDPEDLPVLAGDLGQIRMLARWLLNRAL